jgi:hypothetical protein
MRDVAGNVPPLPGVFPDYRAPIRRNGSILRGSSNETGFLPDLRFLSVRDFLSSSPSSPTGVVGVASVSESCASLDATTFSPAAVSLSA